MNKEIKVIIKDRQTLELLENASKGDIINLASLQEIDISQIEKKIAEQKDMIYTNKLKEYEHTINLKNQLKIQELSNKKDEQITLLEEKLKSLNEMVDLQVRTKLLEKQKDYEKIINELNIKIELFAAQEEIKLNKIKQELINKYEIELREKDNEISKLQFQKSIKNVKQTGENLEAWCDNEVLSYMQNGFFNCVWYKDNEVVKNEDETKGSKGDFVFKIYATSNHLDNELLTSICLEMKDENPDSINKKKNEDYYKQLDKNRNKKGCKYALLVSNLELDKPNLLPIYKVNFYEDMYVVRPGYLMTFLNMIVSLTTKFRDLYLIRKKEDERFIDSQTLNEEFLKLKDSYLDKPLEMLNKELEKIITSSNKIKESAKIIDDSCDKIKEKYIKDIQNKLERFNIKKFSKKLDNYIK